MKGVVLVKFQLNFSKRKRSTFSSVCGMILSGTHCNYVFYFILRFFYMYLQLIKEEIIRYTIMSSTINFAVYILYYIMFQPNFKRHRRHINHLYRLQGI